MSLTESFLDKAKLAQRLREVFDNLQHSISGVETGYQSRHGLKPTDIDPITGEKRGDLAALLARSLQWLLLNDPAYKLAHDNLMNAIREAGQVTHPALERVQTALATEQTIMDKLLSDAARLPDGRYIFKDESGEVRTIDGEVIPDELAATIQWHGHEPTYENITAQRQRIDELVKSENELRGIEAEIGEIHERGNTDSAPLTPDEMQRDTARANDLRDRAEKIHNNVSNNLASETNRGKHSGVERLGEQSISDEFAPKISFGEK